MKMGRFKIVYRFICFEIIAGLFFLWMTMIPVHADIDESGSGLESAIVAEEPEEDIDLGLTYEYNGLRYLLDEEKRCAVVSGSVSSSLKKLVVPENIIYNEAEYPVVGILEYAFEGSNLTSVKLGNNLKEIGEGAFAFSEKIKKVSISLGCERIGDAAFFMCKSLAKVSFGKKSAVAYIGDGAFSGTLIASVSIPDKVKYVGEAAFAECVALTKVTLGSGVESVGAGAFSGCTAIAEFILAKGNKCFEAEKTLLYTKDYKVLLSAPSVEGTVEIHEETEKIAERAFEGNDRLAAVSVPKGVISVGEGAFMNCCLLESADFFEGLTVIEDNAFFGCIKLRSLTIPRTVTEIIGNPFKYCPELSELKVSKDNKSYKMAGGLLLSYDGRTLISAPAVSGILVLGSKIRYVNAYAFCGNSKIAAVKLNSKLKTVGEGAFYDCLNLKVVQVLSESTAVYENEELEEILIL